MHTIRTTCCLIVLYVCASAIGHGQTLVNVALGKPVTGPYYNAGSEVFPPGNITDGLFDDTGAPSNWSCWISPQFLANPTATIDFLGQFVISSIVLQNTHNRGYYDLGTKDFMLRVSADGTNYTTFAAGTFTTEQWTTLSLLTINLDQPITGRYLQFVATTYFGGRTSMGLNELQAFGVAIPEPSVAVLIAGGIGLIGVLALRRRIQGADQRCPATEQQK